MDEGTGDKLVYVITGKQEGRQRRVKNWIWDATTADGRKGKRVQTLSRDRRNSVTRPGTSRGSEVMGSGDGFHASDLP